MGSIHLSLTKVDDGRTVPLHVGASFSLALEESPTTGYRWQLRVDDPAGVAVGADEFIPGVVSIGGSGTRVWALQAMACGSCTLRAELRRAWQSSAQPEASVTLCVEISAR